jgi:hypothetical protein
MIKPDPVDARSSPSGVAVAAVNRRVRGPDLSDILQSARHRFLLKLHAPRFPLAVEPDVEEGRIAQRDRPECGGPRGQDQDDCQASCRGSGFELSFRRRDAGTLLAVRSNFSA